MTALQGLSALEARRFRTGSRALDFLHTGGDGPLAHWELLDDGPTLARWLGVIVECDGVQAHGGDLLAAKDLRRAIRGAVEELISGRPIDPATRSVINSAAGVAPMVPRLAANRTAAIASPVTVSQILSTLARDAIDLFSGAFAGRIRVCAAPHCGLLFVDQSRPGTRRWCSMQRCGTLTKVRKYRARAG
jgi:predicted RNA-binding Zn ribbon-like protein